MSKKKCQWSGYTAVLKSMVDDIETKFVEIVIDETGQFVNPKKTVEKPQRDIFRETEE